MRFELDPAVVPPESEVRVGNVYKPQGGVAARDGCLYVLLAITEPQGIYGQSCLFLTLDRNGLPVRTTQYGLHAVRRMEPVAFVEGLDALSLVMRPL